MFVAYLSLESISKVRGDIPAVPFAFKMFVDIVDEMHRHAFGMIRSSLAAQARHQLLQRLELGGVPFFGAALRLVGGTEDLLRWV